MCRSPAKITNTFAALAAPLNMLHVLLLSLLLGRVLPSCQILKPLPLSRLLPLHKNAPTYSSQPQCGPLQNFSSSLDEAPKSGQPQIGPLQNFSSSLDEAPKSGQPQCGPLQHFSSSLDEAPLEHQQQGMKYMRTDGNSKRQDTVIDDGREAGKQSKARNQNKSMHTHTHASKQRQRQLARSTRNTIMIST